MKKLDEIKEGLIGVLEVRWSAEGEDYTLNGIDYVNAKIMLVYNAVIELIEYLEE